MRLTVKAKLGGGFAIILILMAVVVIVGIRQLHSLDKRLEGIVNVSTEQVKLAHTINGNLLEIVRAEKNTILAETQEKQESYIKEADTFKTELHDHREALVKISDETDKPTLDAFAAAYANYLEVNTEIAKLALLNSDGHISQAFALSTGKGRGFVIQAQALLVELIANTEHKMAQGKLASDKTYRVARTLMSSALVAAIIIGFGIAFWISGSISRGLTNAVEAVQAVVAGDLSQRIDVHRQDEIGILLNAIQAMRAHIWNVLQQINELVWAVQEGNLGARGNAEPFAGGWRDLIVGMNNVLNTFMTPFRPPNILTGSRRGKSRPKSRGKCRGISTRSNRI